MGRSLLHCLGDTLNGVGRHIDALACLRLALPIFREFRDRYGEAVTLHSSGVTCRRLDKTCHPEMLTLLIKTEGCRCPTA